MSFSASTRKALRGAALLLCSLSGWAQSSPVTAEAPTKVVVKAGGAASSKILFRLANGYHTNSNSPSDEYLIPLKLSWEAGPLQVTAIQYPKPHMEKYSFSDKPLSVFSGEFEIVSQFKVAADAPKGPRTVTGKLRYQACTNSMCLPPKTLAVQLPVEIR